MGKRRPRGGEQARGGELPPRQARFVEEYLVDLNATQAAIRAGYSRKNADKIGPELLGKTRVAAAIAAGRAQATGKAEVTVARVLRELLPVGTSDIAEVLEACEWGHLLAKAPAHVRRAIASVKVKRYCEGKGDAAREVELVEFKLWPKLQALELLGRYLAMFTDRHEVTGKDGEPLLGLEMVRRILGAAEAGDGATVH
jgi:phage terminase small subunit